MVRILVCVLLRARALPLLRVSLLSQASSAFVCSFPWQAGGGFGTGVSFDKDLYGGGAAERVESIAAMDIEEEDDAPRGGSGRPSYTMPKNAMRDIPIDADSDDPFKETRRLTIAEREDEYHARRQQHAVMSPARADMFADATPAANLRKPTDALVETKLAREEAELRAKIMKKQEEEKLKKAEAEDRARKERDAKRDGREAPKPDRERERERGGDRDRSDRDRSDRDRERSDRDRSDRDRSDRDRDRSDRDRRDRKEDRKEDRDGGRKVKVLPTSSHLYSA